MPIWVRISATEWMEDSGEPSWDVEQSIELAKLLPGLDVDVLDVSSGGNHPKQQIKVHTYYQTDLANQIHQAVEDAGLTLGIAAVGRITEAKMARSLVQGTRDSSEETVVVEDKGGKVAKVDLVLAARQFLRDPRWVLQIAQELGVAVKWPNQYAAVQPKPKNGL